MKPMKKLILLCSFLTVSLGVLAQSPEAFNYQAVARDNAGNVLANQSVGLKFSILDSDGTTVLYSEDQAVTTNDFGLFNVQIGNGTVLSGNLSGIEWGNGQRFVRVEMDPAGGTAYQSVGTSQLLSVPYALHAQSSGDGLPSGSVGSTLRHNGSNWTSSSNLYNDGFNIGIGTSSPSSLLELEGNNSGATGIIVGNSDSDGNQSLRFEAGTGTGELSFDNSSNILSLKAIPSGSKLSLVGRNNGGITIDENGYVGVNDGTPSAPLNVNSNNNQTSVLIEHNAPLNTSSPNNALQFRTTQHDAGSTFSIYNRMEAKSSNTGALSGTYNFVVGDNNPSTSGVIYGSRTLFTDDITGKGKNLYGYHVRFLGATTDNEFAFYADNGQSYFGDNVGIGITTPGIDLHVKQSSSSNTTSGIRIERDSDTEEWTVFHAATDNLWFSRNGTLACWIAPDGTLNTPSDRRLKNSIKPLGQVLDKVMKLEASEYFYNFLENQKEKSIGFIAQDVQKLFPEVVRIDEEADYTVLNYDNFGVIAIKAIQEQQKIIEAQQKQIEQLTEAFEQLQHK